MPPHHRPDKMVAAHPAARPIVKVAQAASETVNLSYISIG
jgi:hypothetical protein